MRKIILFSVFQRLLYLFSRVESLTGDNFTRVRGGEYPFIATFQFYPNGDNFCGGALISTQHVITVAHCRSLSDFRIVFEGVHLQQEFILSYTAASWKTYFTWTIERNIPYNFENMLDVAIVKLTDKVFDIKPVPLNGLTKEHFYGKRAIMTGRKNDVVSKATVNVLNDADCNRNMDRLNQLSVVERRMLCTTANPFALLTDDDGGYPLLHVRDKSLLGIAVESFPEYDEVSGNLSNAVIRQNQVNFHFSLAPYRLFIFSVIPAVPAA